MLSCYHVTIAAMLLCHHVTLPYRHVNMSCQYVIMLPYRHVIMLPCQHVIMLPCYQLSRYYFMVLPCHHGTIAAMLSCHHVSTLPC